ncbi:MAG: ABC transporter permease [Deltaproteobacteria bacterium]|nr:ABC transporter permease [Deltaproteobacteria bacterium]
MKKIYFLLIFLLLPAILLGHDVSYSVNQQNAYIVEIYYANGSKFAYESYEIYKPGNEKTAYQVGRTDESGRIVFLPDVPGKWKIRAFSDDGHGVTFEIEVKAGQTQSEKKIGFFERFAKPVFGAGIILIIFSVLNIFVRRKESEKKNNQ